MLINGSCSVYRCYAKNGKLLYVGMSENPLGRLGLHKRTSPWLLDCVRVTLEWHPDRFTAHQYEVLAIRVEKPRYNIAHAPRPKHRRTPRKPRPQLTEQQLRMEDDEMQRGPGSSYP